MSQNKVQQNMKPNTLIMSRQEKYADQTRDSLYPERLLAPTEIKEGEFSTFFW